MTQITNIIDYFSYIKEKFECIKNIDIDIINDSEELLIDNIEIEIEPTTTATDIKDLKDNLLYNDITNYRVYYITIYNDDGFEDYISESIIEEFGEDCKNVIATLDILEDQDLIIHYNIPKNQVVDSLDIPENLWLDPRLEKFFLRLNCEKPLNLYLTKIPCKKYIDNVLNTIKNSNFDTISGDYDVYLYLKPQGCISRTVSEFMVNIYADFKDSYQYPKISTEKINFPLSFNCKKRNIFPRFEDKCYRETISDINQGLVSMYIYEELIKPLNLYRSFNTFEQQNDHHLVLLINKPINWNNVEIIESLFEIIILENNKVIAAIYNGTNLDVKTKKFVETIKNFVTNNI